MEFWVPLLSALAGALIGSATTIITLIIQSRKDERRHVREIASTLAIADWKRDFDYAIRASEQENRNISMAPLGVYFWHQLKTLDLAANGKLNPENIRNLKQEQREIGQAYNENN